MNLETIMSIIGTVTIVVAAGIAVWQIREDTRARSLEGFLALAEKMKKDKEARKCIYDGLAKIHALTDKEKQKLLSDPKLVSEIEKVCVSFDQMGVLIEHRLLPEDVAFSMYFDVILRTWYLVEPYVQAERERRKSDAWMASFETLNKKCLKYWKRQLKKHPEWKYMKKPGDIYHYLQEIKSNV
jgi:hypothetical protein